MRFQEFQLRNLGRVIAMCWTHAEDATAKAIAEKYFDPPEECITFLFTGELRAAVERASRHRQFEQAFMADLQNQLFPGLAENALGISRGLIARVNFHSRQNEGLRSGSDFGVVITRPSVHGLPGSYKISLERDRSRGLMVQAKLNLRGKEESSRLKWRALKKKQEEVLLDHCDYYALLLYRLGGIARSALAPFSWQLCRGYSVPEIKNWLRSGKFPHEMRSADVVKALSAGAVGSSSAEIIGELIDPLSSRPNAIEVRVFWPDSDGPPKDIYLKHKVEQKAERFVRVRR